MTIFKWEIEDMYNVFSSSPIMSSPFHIEPSRTYEFCLLLYPFGRDSLQEMILVLSRCDSNDGRIKLRYKLQFDGPISTNEPRFGVFTYIFKIPMQFPESNVYLTKPISERQPLLKITCEIYSHIFEDIDKEVMTDLSSNYESLLEDHTFKDVKINFGNRDFYFHKAILEARCGNLAEQLRSYEGHTGQLRTYEGYIDPEMLESIAQFLYSGKFTTWKTKIKSSMIGKFRRSLYKITYPFIISEYSAKTLIERNRYIFDWVIEYNYIDTTAVFTYVIAEGGTNIKISFHPFVINNGPNFTVEMLDGHFIRCRVDIDVGNKFINLVELSNTETNPGFTRVNKFLSITDVMLKYKRLMLDDTMKLKIDILLCSSKYTSNIDTICYTNIYKDDIYMYNLREDFNWLFHNSQCRDFVIIVNYQRFHEDYARHYANYSRFYLDYSAFEENYDKFHAMFMNLNAQYMRFPVHKAILSARSPVFRRLLSHDNMENRTGEITITDIKPYVLHFMLLFMYYGHLCPLNIDLALDLNSAADKYEIEVLIKKCSDFLESNIRSDTVDIIQEHASCRNIGRLVTACVQFRTRNIH